MSARVFGLDIGSTSIRCALVKKEGSAFNLESIAVSPSTPKGILSEALIDLEALADVTRKMLSSANLKTVNVAFSLPESQVYTKVIEMPLLSDQELSAALKFEMEQYIPLPLDQVKTDWVILGKSESSNSPGGEAGLPAGPLRQDGSEASGAGKKTMDVMIIAAPINIINKYEKLSEMLNLKPESIESEVISVHRALLPLVSNTSSHMILHIGANTSSICIVKRGIIKTILSMPLGGTAITRAISLDLGIDSAQAEKYKKAYGLNQDAFEGKIGKALAPILQSIVGDVKKTMLSFREKNANEVISQVVLSGGSSLLPGIDVFFTNNLSTQVVLGNCFAAYSMGNVPRELVIQAPSFNVVVGLALRNLL
ncbi:MAG: pilus assembly protein PilM [Candidatus Levybacteria bacterium]|nr:pilus assembly protein PilM [Candidatus Levybacteria bacterium]